MKRYGVVFALLGVMSHALAIECQMLLPETKQKEILGERWYPQGSRIRISQAAIRDGYAAIGKKDYETAMREFNRAWRFRPEAPDAYWGAAITFGLMAEAEKTPSKAMLFIEASLALFEQAKKRLPDNAVVRENWQFDYAATLYIAGKILFASDKPAAEKFFAEAEKIWLSLLADRNLQKERDKKVYCRACMHLIKLYRDWDKIELAARYLQKLSAGMRGSPSLPRLY